MTLGAGLFAAGALVFTARNFTLSRRTFELTEQGQVTDRYTKAIEQLGSDKLDVRIGGIYALERVARDSARDHPTVMEVLSAFVREHSHEQRSPTPEPTDALPTRRTRPDVQAAVTVIGRRISRNDRERIDLSGALLSGALLADTDLAGAILSGADLWRDPRPRGPLRREPRPRGPWRREPLRRGPHRRDPHRRGPRRRDPHRCHVARRRASSGGLETRPRLFSPGWAGTGSGRRRWTRPGLDLPRGRRTDVLRPSEV